MRLLSRVPANPLTRILPASISGVILGHAFVYSLLFGPARHQHTTITATDHSYLPAVASLGVLLLALSAWWHWRAGRTRFTSTHKSVFMHTFAVLFVVQSLVFLGMEIGEQYISGGNHAVEHLLASSFLVYGCAFQLLTACLVTVLITGAESLGAFIAERNTKTIKTLTISPPIFMPGLGRFEAHLNIRAPPSNP